MRCSRKKKVTVFYNDLGTLSVRESITHFSTVLKVTMLFVFVYNYTLPSQKLEVLLQVPFV